MCFTGNRTALRFRLRTSASEFDDDALPAGELAVCQGFRGVDGIVCAQDDPVFTHAVGEQIRDRLRQRGMRPVRLIATSMRSAVPSAFVSVRVNA